MSYGLLLLRVFVGAAFFGHGTQKLFGWFGGYGPLVRDPDVLPHATGGRACAAG